METTAAATPAAAFLFHTALHNLIPGVTWHDDHNARATSAYLQADDSIDSVAMLEWVWPVGDAAAQSLDYLTDDCLPMVNAVLDTFQRHVSTGHVRAVRCFMSPRKAPTALSDPGWLEWGVVLVGHDGRTLLYIGHIQRAIGAPVERHT